MSAPVVTAWWGAGGPFWIGMWARLPAGAGAVMAEVVGLDVARDGRRLLRVTVQLESGETLVLAPERLVPTRPCRLRLVAAAS